MWSARREGEAIDKGDVQESGSNVTSVSQEKIALRQGKQSRGSTKEVDGRLGIETQGKNNSTHDVRWRRPGRGKDTTKVPGKGYGDREKKGNQNETQCRGGKGVGEVREPRKLTKCHR